MEEKRKSGPRPGNGHNRNKKAGPGGGVAVDVSSVINSGSSKIKKKIRDIKRLLSKDKLPSDLRINNERALKLLENELADTQINLKAKKMGQKYNMVKFFERTKALRKYKQASKELKALEEKEEGADGKDVKKEIKKVKKKLQHCEVDLLYIYNYPKLEKYISLYVGEEGPEGTEEGKQLSYKDKKGIQKTNERRAALKKEIQEKMSTGKLEVTLKDILEGDANKGKKKKDREEKKLSTGKAVDADEDAVEGEEEDDFFE